MKEREMARLKDELQREKTRAADAIHAAEQRALSEVRRIASQAVGDRVLLTSAVSCAFLPRVLSFSLSLSLSLSYGVTTSVFILVSSTKEISCLHSPCISTMVSLPAFAFISTMASLTGTQAVAGSARATVVAAAAFEHTVDGQNSAAMVGHFNNINRDDAPSGVHTGSTGGTAQACTFAGDPMIAAGHDGGDCNAMAVRPFHASTLAHLPISPPPSRSSSPV
jgi:hypothetical protein